MTQIAILRKLEARCPAIRAAYLLYDRTLRREALLPLAKPIDAMEESVEVSGYTDLSAGTSDLASFVTSTLADSADQGGPTGSFEELVSALANKNLRYLVSNSLDRDFGPKLARRLAERPGVRTTFAQAVLPRRRSWQAESAPTWTPKPEPWPLSVPTAVRRR